RLLELLSHPVAFFFLAFERFLRLLAQLIFRRRDRLLVLRRPLVLRRFVALELLRLRLVGLTCGPRDPEDGTDSGQDQSTQACEMESRRHRFLGRRVAGHQAGARMGACAGGRFNEIVLPRQERKVPSSTVSYAARRWRSNSDRRIDVSQGWCFGA